MQVIYKHSHSLSSSCGEGSDKTQSSQSDLHRQEFTNWKESYQSQHCFLSLLVQKKIHLVSKITFWVKRNLMKYMGVEQLFYFFIPLFYTVYRLFFPPIFIPTPWNMILTRHPQCELSTGRENFFIFMCVRALSACGFDLSKRTMCLVWLYVKLQSCLYAMGMHVCACVLESQVSSLPPDRPNLGMI